MIAPYHTHHFSTTFFINGHEIMFSQDYIIRIMSLLVILNPSFLTILLDFQKIISSYFCDEFQSMSSCNIIEMLTSWLVLAIVMVEVPLN